MQFLFKDDTIPLLAAFLQRQDLRQADDGESHQERWPTAPLSHGVTVPITTESYLRPELWLVPGSSLVVTQHCAVPSWPALSVLCRMDFLKTGSTSLTPGSRTAD